MCDASAQVLWQSYRRQVLAALDELVMSGDIVATITYWEKFQTTRQLMPEHQDPVDTSEVDLIVLSFWREKQYSLS